MATDTATLSTTPSLSSSSSELALPGVVRMLQSMKDRLCSHEMYSAVRDCGIEGIREFQRHHVWAVFDYFQLLKRLQQELTCVELPWRPVGDPALRRFINEIVLEEETDVYEDQTSYGSHLELYLRGMEAVGTDTTPVRTVLRKLAKLQADRSVLIEDVPELLRDAIVEAGGPKAAADHVYYTTKVAFCGDAAEVAGVFTFGRENIIPGMFTALLPSLEHAGEQTAVFRYYLERHIELDGDSHGPLALRLVAALCGNDQVKLKKLLRASKTSLANRHLLWSAIAANMPAPIPSNESPRPSVAQIHAKL